MDSRSLRSVSAVAVLFLDSETLAVERRIFVRDDAGPVGFLNEFEPARGKLYANVWQTDLIAIIDPTTGKVTGWIDPGPERRHAVARGGRGAQPCALALARPGYQPVNLTAPNSARTMTMMPTRGGKPGR